MHFEMALLYHKGKETFSVSREVSTHDLYLLDVFIPTSVCSCLASCLPN